MSLAVQHRRATGWFIPLIAIFAAIFLTGCVTHPVLLKPDQQRTIDRSVVEYPAGFELHAFVRNLTAPSAIAFDTDGTIWIAENGANNDSPRIFGYRGDGALVQIYPTNQQIPLLSRRGFRIYGPIGGMLAD